MKIVVLFGRGEGCDYTIGCNVNMVYVDDTVDNDKYLLQLIEDYGNELKAVHISTIKDKKIYDIDDFLEANKPAEKRVTDAIEKASQAELDKEELVSNMRKILEEGGVAVPPDADLSDPVVMQNLMFALGKNNKENE